MNLKNTKIKVTPEQSKKIQEIAFEQGFEWGYGGKNITHADKPCLYIHNDLSITCSISEETFDDDENEELNADEIIKYYSQQESEHEEFAVFKVKLNKTGSFSWAVEQMDKEKILILNNIQYKISDYTFWSRNNNSSLWGSINVNLNMIYATHWKIYEENKFKDMSIEELLYQAHMLGQKDAGYMEPSYSSDRTGCSELTKELYRRDLK